MNIDQFNYNFNTFFRNYLHTVLTRETKLKIIIRYTVFSWKLKTWPWTLFFLSKNRIICILQMLKISLKRPVSMTISCRYAKNILWFIDLQSSKQHSISLPLLKINFEIQHPRVGHCSCLWHIIQELFNNLIENYTFFSTFFYT